MQGCQGRKNLRKKAGESSDDSVAGISSERLAKAPRLEK